MKEIDISSMTLAQAKEYCRKWSHEHGYPCEKTGCELKRRNICIDWVHEWDLDRLTPEELKICMAIGAKWISMDLGCDGYVSIWSEKPNRNNENGFENAKADIGCISAEKFPSVSPGDCICVEELLNER